MTNLLHWNNQLFEVDALLPGEVVDRVQLKDCSPLLVGLVKVKLLVGNHLVNFLGNILRKVVIYW